MNENVKELFQAQFNSLSERGKLFRSTVTGRQVWETYMRGFGEDPVFRDPQSSEHNCNTCRNFFERYGNIVAVDEDLNIITMYDGETSDEYRESFRLMSELLKGAPIGGVFVETFNNLNFLPYEQTNKNAEDFALGISQNVKQYTEEEAAKYGVVEAGRVYTFHHFMVRLRREFVTFTNETPDSLTARYREDKVQLEKGLNTIGTDTLELVADLINQGSLLNGDAYLSKVEDYLKKAREYADIPQEKRDNWLWVTSYKYPFARFRTELIGTLCTELAEGKELAKACTDWNKRVDPANYMKAKAPITQQMIDAAKAFVMENGYEQSFNRRCATMEDIKVCDILHANAGDGTIKPVSIFDGLKPTATRHKSSEFDGVPVVGIDEFMRDILPTCKSVEVYLQNRMEKNFVTLTAPAVADSKPIFKWPNNFGWTYNGNLAGKSEIREAVKQAGGFVDAYFRFSILWNENGQDICDLDAHAFEPNGTEIYYSTYKGRKTPICGGMLDIDMIRPEGRGVENIFWTDPERLQDGDYKFGIVNYDDGPNTVTKAEIAIGDEVFQYEVPHRIPHRQPAWIATVTIKDGRMTAIKHSDYLKDGSGIVREIYGLRTCEFHRVSLVCLSPNYWQSEVGHKHYFFMLDGAKAPRAIRGFHNEFLTADLLDHRKVMEVLGQTQQVESTDGQLSGLGFNATVRDEMVVRVTGGDNCVFRIKF